MEKLIYVAGPYSGDVENNIKRAEEVSIELIRNGWYVITPHKNTAGYEQYEDDQITYQTWIEMDLDILKRCDAIFVMNGWKRSRGTQREITLALDLNLLVFFEEFIPANELNIR